MEEQVSEAAEESAPQTVSDATSQTEEQASDRPEWLPEKFSSPEDMAKSYQALSSKLGEKEEDIRNRLMEELQTQASEGVPEEAGGYELPDFIDEEAAMDNDLLQTWAEHCHSNGYTHEEFQKGIEMYMNGVGTGPDLEAEAAKLGDNSNERIEAVSLFAHKFFPEEALPAIERLMEGADGVVAMELIMEKMQDTSVSDGNNINATFNETELQEMMKDERYWSPARRDMNFVKQVDEGFRKLYG